MLLLVDVEMCIRSVGNMPNSKAFLSFGPFLVVGRKIANFTRLQCAHHWCIGLEINVQWYPRQESSKTHGVLGTCHKPQIPLWRVQQAPLLIAIVRSPCCSTLPGHRRPRHDARALGIAPGTRCRSRPAAGSLHT